MFFGREFWRYPDHLLSMLSGSGIQRNVNPRLKALLKVYIRLFGIPHPSIQLRALYFQASTRRIKFSRALDAGCGIGLHSIYLARKHPLSMVDACDIDSESVEIAKGLAQQMHLDNLHIFQQDLLEFNRVGEYDFICALDVLEHIEDEVKVITNIRHALKDEGVLLITTPHQRHVKRYFSGLGLKYEGKGHVRQGYSEDELRRLLQDNGFKITKMRNVWGIFGESCEELYMWSLSHLPFVLSGLVFPFLSVVASLDMVAGNSKGYGLLVLAQKEPLRRG